MFTKINSLTLKEDSKPISMACSWLNAVLVDFPFQVQIDFWNKHTLQVGKNPAGNQLLKVKLEDPSALQFLLQSTDPLVFVEAYLNGKVSIDGEIENILSLLDHLGHHMSQQISAFNGWLEYISHSFKRHSLMRDKNAVQAHYDLSDEFYSLWLDPQFVYSCAHFETAQTSLAAAQKAKLDLICRKLLLKPGETLLDIGCGWGALLRWAVTHYGVHGYGITLSENQLAYNKRLVHEYGLQNSLQVELRDYRALPEGKKFDKIVSVGMVEHVGLQNYPLYFQSIYNALKPGGLFLNHGITTSSKWSPYGIPERFINRYIFPDGELANLPHMLTTAKNAGWEIIDVDCWRPHYAKTLLCWAKNLEKSFDQAVALVGIRTARLWLLYLAGSARGFNMNMLSIYQTLLRRIEDEEWNLPLTRESWLC